jgi:hypothetical protein
LLTCKRLFGSLHASCVLSVSSGFVQRRLHHRLVTLLLTMYLQLLPVCVCAWAHSQTRCCANAHYAAAGELRTYGSVVTKLRSTLRITRPEKLAQHQHVQSGARLTAAPSPQLAFIIACMTASLCQRPDCMWNSILCSVSGRGAPHVGPFQQVESCCLTLQAPGLHLSFDSDTSVFSCQFLIVVHL